MALAFSTMPTLVVASTLAGSVGRVTIEPSVDDEGCVGNGNSSVLCGHRAAGLRTSRGCMPTSDPFAVSSCVLHDDFRIDMNHE